MSTQVCPAGGEKERWCQHPSREQQNMRCWEKWAPTPLAEEGELLVAVLGVPAVKTPLVHAFDLKALQLGAEDVVLGWGGLSEIGQAFRWQKNLH